MNRYYTGETAEVAIRLNQHRSHYFSTNFTRNSDDWELVFTYECFSKKDALFLEAFVKRMKSAQFIKRIIETPEVLDDILSKRE